MTDNTKPEALDLADWLEAVGGGPSAKRCAALLREQHARIAELETQLESIGAGGVSGPLMGRATDMSKEREALRTIGEEQAFEAWFKMDCPVEGANAKIAAKAAWKARASLSANAGEPVAHLWQHCETGRTRIVMPDMIVDADASWQVVGPLYLGVAPPTAQAEGWTKLPGQLPEPGMPVLLDIGKKHPIRAMWAAKHTVQAADDDTDWGEYIEADDMYYAPEGWYEWNQCEDNHWRVTETPRAWMPLPPISAEGVEHG